jgi:ubiquinone/menaquinone biosynthesis C-methylase UbiE
VSEERNLHDDVRSAWDELAAFWDERMEAGATWQRHLIQPSVERLLRLEPGERVLEIASGNGEFARRMSELGGHVLATDFSEAMLEIARSHGGEVEYRYADATEEESLLALGDPGAFDAVVSNMAIMDMEFIAPMVVAAARLLKPGGRFVFRRYIPPSTRATQGPRLNSMWRAALLRSIRSRCPPPTVNRPPARASPFPVSRSSSGTSTVRSG